MVRRGSAADRALQAVRGSCRKRRGLAAAGLRYGDEAPLRRARVAAYRRAWGRPLRPREGAHRGLGVSHAGWANCRAPRTVAAHPNAVSRGALTYTLASFQVSPLLSVCFKRLPPHTLERSIGRRPGSKQPEWQAPAAHVHPPERWAVGVPCVALGMMGWGPGHRSAADGSHASGSV